MAQAQLIPSTQVSLPPITYKGQPVITTEMLAQAYGCSAENIRRNFSNNRDRFVEGKHYFILTNGDLKTFRDCVKNFPAVIPARTRNLTIYTEYGSLLHAKSLNTDQAWSVYEVLVETFFRVVKAVASTPSLTPSTTEDRKPLEKLVKVWCSMSSMIHAQAWTQVDSHFNLNSITDLPVEWIPDALAFVQSKIDSLPKALPPAKPTRSMAIRWQDLPPDQVDMLRTHIGQLRHSLDDESRSLQSCLESILPPGRSEVGYHLSFAFIAAREQMLKAVEAMQSLGYAWLHSAQRN